MPPVRGHLVLTCVIMNRCLVSNHTIVPCCCACFFGEKLELPSVEMNKRVDAGGGIGNWGWCWGWCCEGLCLMSAEGVLSADWKRRNCVPTTDAAGKMSYGSVAHVSSVRIQIHFPLLVSQCNAQEGCPSARSGVPFIDDSFCKIRGHIAW